VIAFADAATVVSTISAAVGAVAALVTIVFAKRSADTGRDAAQAGRDAVRDERAMRIEEDFRRFAEALIMLYQHAGDAQQDPENPKAPARMRQAQIRVVGTLIPRARIDLPITPQPRSTKRFSALSQQTRSTHPPPSCSATSRAPGIPG
jgi:hypothetical protein